MPKIIFCGDIKFPHGLASANYVQCLASAFISIGYEAYVCATVDRSELSKHGEKVHGITVLPLNDLGGGFRRLKNLKTSFFPKIEAYLNGFEMSSEDILVSYAITPEISDFVLKYAKKRGIRSMICPVEWFDRTHYKGGILSYHYWVFARNFYICSPKFDLIFSISTKIHNYFLKRHGNSLLIPCLVDVHEFTYDGVKPYDKIRVLFPGVPGEKGAFAELVDALDSLDATDLDHFEIHLTRSSQEAIAPFLTDKIKQYQNALFVFHGWLSYAELVNLYKKMNYLFLVREESHATMSNFPSKGPEALTYGVIPIATRLGDFEKNYLTDGFNSVIVDNVLGGTTSAIKHISTLPEKDYLELSKNARKTAEEKFDFHVWGPVINNFIRRGKNE